MIWKWNEAADTANIPDGMSLPKELKLPEDRLAAMAAAKVKIAAHAAERYARERAEFDEKMRQRQARAQETGKKPRGKTPKPPEPGAKDNDQINLTDEESRIMPISGGGFEQCYNAQAGVDAHTMLVVATTLIADTGSCSEHYVTVCEEAKIVPLIAVARQVSKDATGLWALPGVSGV